MSDAKYQPGVIQGIALSRHHGVFPEEIPGLGAMCGAQPGGRCAFCPEGTHPQFSFTWVTYGQHHVCGRCARKLANEGDPEVEQMLARAKGAA